MKTWRCDGCGKEMVRLEWEVSWRLRADDCGIEIRPTRHYCTLDCLTGSVADAQQELAASLAA